MITFAVANVAKWRALMVCFKVKNRQNVSVISKHYDMKLTDGASPSDNHAQYEIKNMDQDRLYCLHRRKDTQINVVLSVVPI